MRSRFGRRRLLAAIVAMGAFLPVVRQARGRVVASDPAAARLIGLLKHRHSARALGSVYLATHAQEADAQKLVELVIRSDDDPLIADRTSDAGLRAWLRRRQARDFATGRIVNQGGWLLSATEVRICALAALTWGHAAT
jgi:hypothetical protein